ncbi:hybrid sensor histidine kinase/response regulator [Calothrix sp. NIES-2098]|uniref:hybrid sensor histidine kinase/response regulator n=1 Tax=Calothrix sp. NIES-2098 TaxID=1954171 RepID=UPI000B5FE49E|nr:CheA signal transduction histidine kinase [Calothrix sp. NIES-2098]
MSDYTILELFRQEIETQVATLKQCLPILKTQPLSIDEVEKSIQAAHGLWGTTQILEITAAANLAQIMKECLIAAQKESINLGVEQIDTLLHTCDLLLSMSKATAANFESWMSEHDWDFKSTQRSIVNILNSEVTTATQSIVDSSVAASHPIDIQDSSSEIVISPAISAVNTEATMGTTPQGDVDSPDAPPFPADIEDWSPQIPPKEVISAVEVTPSFKSDDSSMMDLFRLEAEAQVSILNDGLLVIETKPQSAQELEALMRAAHSIKGAARLVGLDMAVQLAHVMEDCFVAAQNKIVTLYPEQVDVLLQGVDLLQNISQLSNEELATWLAEHQDDFTATCGEIAAILQPNADIKPQSHKQMVTAAVATPVEPNPVSRQPVTRTATLVKESAIVEEPVAITADETEKTAAGDRVVRVSADNLNRIMGLAGESLIETNWLQPFADAMMTLKSRMLEVSRSLEQLQESLDQNLFEQDGKDFLAQARQQKQECLDFLGDRLDELELYVRRTASLSDRLYREVINSHMRPFADGVQGFPRMIRDLARKLNKQVKLEIIGKATPVDRDILKKLEAPLTHILRNAVDHGLELPDERLAAGKPALGTIRVEAFHRGGMLAITITDDGRGINREQLRQKTINKNLTSPEMAAQLSDAELLEFLFLPGFSTAKQVTEISGRGVGLDIAKSMAQEVGGTVRAISPPGKGTSFHFQLPLTLSVVRTLLVEISTKPYAIPLARIDQIVTLDRTEIHDIENRQYFTMNSHNIGLITAHQVLELPEIPQQNDLVPVVVISDQSHTYGLVVDKFLGERDLVVRPLDPRLGKVPDISATALLADGSPILIVDVSDMVRSVDAILKGGRLSKVNAKLESEISSQRKRILVVDDSITVREMERKLLENRGYFVDTAVNGMEGWNAVRSKNYDLVISDIDMPRMNGIELVQQIKSNPRLHSVPVIIVSYRDREDDRIQGLEAGADYYLTKSSFQDETLVNAVIDLIGK